MTGAAFLGAGGCEPKPTHSAAANRHSDSLASWPFWPTSLRVHPSTRLLTDPETGHLVVEARIEFLDPDRVTSKAVGELTLQLHAAQSGDRLDDEPVQTWNQDLRDLTLNQRQYDDVMRSYLFRLQINRSTLPNEPELRVYFLGSDGQKLNAAATLKRLGH